jgi:hypothetical protein
MVFRTGFPTRILYFIKIAGLLLLGGCGSDQSSTTDESGANEDSSPVAKGVIEHPSEDRIPHTDRTIIPITKDSSFETLPNPPHSLRVLRKFLQASESVDTTRIKLFVKRTPTVRIASLGANRLIILDGHPGNRLFEYNTRVDTLTQIAAPGQGPGELAFTMDLTQDSRSVYIARQDWRIYRFTCESSPCTYDAATRLNVSVASVANRDDGLAILAQPSNRKRGLSLEEIDGAIHLVNSEGSIQNTFGAIYQTRHLLVRTSYARAATLAYSFQRREYVLGSEKLPYVWVYENAGDVESVFRVSDFRPLRMEYDTDDRSLRKRFEKDYSTLRVLGPLDERFAVPLVRHHTLGPDGVQTQRVDYYVVDLKTNETYFLGTDSLGKGIVERTFLVTGEHQVLVENGQVGIVR